ncbi:hypothetical protein L228DRAFT_280758 [Xylona heveae TC161]|uniref:RNA polymerase I-specific transcription initiation factor RRN6-like protein n=1 Tax=Xylona heveae (strain CBS 132557 / TC161) TaxID=1328760 RepID=A0A165IXT6_XYLHT|nr:hypothetical protein L228DRAFT_280758 [Xylona heveae TC161]KZF25521.1 hypothetical protein L228DRAFT_280758 [Xylona heveae TC161]
MADHRLNDLLYGHLGEAIYDRDTQTWHFSRQLGRRNILHPVGTSTVPIPPSQLLTEHESLQGKRTKKKREALNLSKIHPEIVPGLELLAPLAKISEVASTVTDTYEPTSAELLAIGTAEDVDNQKSGTSTVSIAAVAGGELGETVILVHLRKEQLGWKGYKGTRLSVQTFGDGEKAPWQGDSGPVRQICFAESDGEGAGWLAVRFNTYTAILRPAFRRKFSASFAFDPSVPSANHRRTQIDPNPILTLQCGETGGAPHADVTFNPWYQRQFAVIDQEGNWSIWNAEGRFWKRRTFRGDAGKKGNIFEGLDEKKLLPNMKQTDGWARICWAANVKTIAMCTRRHFAVFNLAEQPVRLNCPELGMIRSTSWFLDMKRSPANGSHVFVLTSTHLYWLDVSGPEDAFDEDQGRSAVKILMSWRHYRSQDDTSLQMHLSKVEEGDGTSILIYSRLNDLISVFQFAMPSDPPSLPTSIADPYILKLPPTLLSTATQDDRSHACNILTLTLRPLDYVLAHGALPAGPGNTYQEQGIRFFQLTVLCNDLSVHEALYYRRHDEGKGEDDHARSVLVEEPTIRSKVDKTLKSSNRIDDDFIVADDEIELAETSSRRSREGYYGRKGRTNKAIGLSDDEDEDGLTVEDPYTVPFERVYDMAFRDAIQVREGSVSEDPEFSDYLHTLREAFDAKIEAGESPIVSLLELGPSRPRVDDIDQASTDIDELLKWLWERELKESGPGENRLAITQLAVSDLFPLQPSTKPGKVSSEGLPSSLVSSFPSNSLSAIYDYLISLWLAPLPNTVPGRTRLAKERVVRKAAAELFLASIGLRVIRNSAPSVGDATQSQASRSLTGPTTAEPSLPGEYNLAVRGRYHDHDELDDSPSKRRGRQNSADARNSARRGPRSPLGRAAVEPSSEVPMDQGFQLTNPSTQFSQHAQTPQDGATTTPSALNAAADLPPSSPPVQPATAVGDETTFPSSPLAPPPQASQQLPPLQESNQADHVGAASGPSRLNRRGSSPIRGRGRSRSRSGSISSRTPSRRRSISTSKGKGKAVSRSISRSTRGYTTATSTDDDFSQDEEDLASFRLRQYVPVAPQPPLPRSMSQILSQWTIGEDPDNFDWEASQLRGTLGLASQSMSQSQGLFTPYSGDDGDFSQRAGLASEASMATGAGGIPADLAHLSPEKAARELRHRRRREERDRRRLERHERRQRMLTARENQRREQGSLFFSEPGYMSGVLPSDGLDDPLQSSALRPGPRRESRGEREVAGPVEDAIPEEDEMEHEIPDASQRGPRAAQRAPRTPAARVSGRSDLGTGFEDREATATAATAAASGSGPAVNHPPPTPFTGFPPSSPLRQTTRSQFATAGRPAPAAAEFQGFLDQSQHRRSSFDALAGMNDMPMTQIERGAFGARTPAAATAAGAHTPASGRRTGGKRKRPRMAGF